MNQDFSLRHLCVSGSKNCEICEVFEIAAVGSAAWKDLLGNLVQCGKENAVPGKEDDSHDQAVDGCQG